MRVAVVVDRCRACGLAEERDSFWVPAEVRDVIPDPLDGETLVQEGQVVWRGGISWEAKDGHAIAAIESASARAGRNGNGNVSLQGNNDNIFLVCKSTAIHDGHV